MLNVTKELTALARKLGYTGKAPDMVAKAINAITASVGEGDSGNDSGALILNLTYVSEENGFKIPDYTAQEILDFINSGKPVYLRCAYRCTRYV